MKQESSLAVRAEELVAIARQQPFIEKVEYHKGYISEVDHAPTIATIHYKPVTINRAVLTHLFVAVCADNRLYLCQGFDVGRDHQHPHGSGILCSYGHDDLTRLFRQGRHEDLLFLGLTYFGTLNVHSMVHATTPGLFDCVVCSKPIWKNVRYTNVRTFFHQKCAKRCSSCGRVSMNRPSDVKIVRRTWPQSGLRRLTCAYCLSDMQHSRAVALCATCHEPLYSNRTPATAKSCCMRVSDHLYFENNYNYRNRAQHYTRYYNKVEEVQDVPF